MNFKLDNRFNHSMRGTIEHYVFQVGVLKDAPHKFPLSPRIHGHKGFYGIKARKTSRKVPPWNPNVRDASQAMREAHNYLKAPFEARKNKDVITMLNDFFNVVKGRSRPARLKNLIQAVIRNPMLRGDYGGNTARTAKKKGFSHASIDTGQLYRRIQAKVLRRGLSV